MADSASVWRLWGYYNVPLNDGMSYGNYAEQLTHLLWEGVKSAFDSYSFRRWMRFIKRWAGFRMIRRKIGGLSWLLTLWNERKRPMLNTPAPACHQTGTVGGRR